MPKADKTKRSAAKEIVLSGNLTLGFAGQVREQLLQALNAADAVQIVLKEIEEIDLSLVQIVCAAHRSAIRQGKILTLLDQLPAPFVRIIEDAGLQGHIGCSSDGRGGCLWHSQTKTDTKHK